MWTYHIETTYQIVYSGEGLALFLQYYNLSVIAINYTHHSSILTYTNTPYERLMSQSKESKF